MNSEMNDKTCAGCGEETSEWTWWNGNRLCPGCLVFVQCDNSHANMEEDLVERMDIDEHKRA